jgi:hypothetical protein
MSCVVIIVKLVVTLCIVRILIGILTEIMVVQLVTFFFFLTFGEIGFALE